MIQKFLEYNKNNEMLLIESLFDEHSLYFSNIEYIDNEKLGLYDYKYGDIYAPHILITLDEISDEVSDDLGNELLEKLSKMYDLHSSEFKNADYHSNIYFDEGMFTHEGYEISDILLYPKGTTDAIKGEKYLDYYSINTGKGVLINFSEEVIYFEEHFWVERFNTIIEFEKTLDGFSISLENFFHKLDKEYQGFYDYIENIKYNSIDNLIYNIKE